MARIITRLLLLLIALAAATALMVGGLAALASITPDAAAPRLERNQVVELRKSIEASVNRKVGASAQDPADDASGATPTPTVVLVFAGIVLMAALPPVYAVHVYQRPYHQRF